MAPELRLDLGVSIGTMGLALGAIEFAIGVTVLAWGFTVDRIGDKISLIAALFIGAVAIIIASQAGTFVGLMVGLLVLGMCGGAICTAGPRIVLASFRGGKQVFALSIRQAAIPLSGLLAASAVANVASSHGSDAGLLVLGLVLLFAALVAVACIMPGSLRRRGRGGGDVAQGPAGADLEDAPSQGATPTGSATGDQAGEREVRAREVLSDRRIWRLAAASATMLFGEASLLGFAGLFLVERQGLSTVQAGLCFSLMLGIAIVMLLVVGATADHRQKRFAPLRVVATVMICSYLALVILSGSKSFLAVIAVVAGGGLAQSWLPLITAILGEMVPPNRQGAAIGMQQTVMATTGAISPVIFGFIVDNLSWQVAYLGIAAVVTIGMLLLRGFKDEPADSAAPKARPASAPAS